MKTNLMLIGAALTLSSCSLLSRPADPVSVTVVGLNDFHGNLEATSFAGVKIPDPADATKTVTLRAGGIEAIGGYLAQERAKNANLVFVGAGDLIGASPVTSSLLRDEPSVLALSRMGMKASSLGNHEFDQGYKELLRMQNGGCDSNDASKACKFENPYPGAGFK
ncbi:MAG: 5-nucleotidase, partial [Deinococcus sp.]|nr:5-nucleotidase [Deinococcus sp.]